MVDIHPIRNASDYEWALAEINSLIKQNPDGNTLDEDRLELLSLLVSDYEAKHNPILPPDDPVEVILFYMDQKWQSRKDMEQYLGSKARFRYSKPPALAFPAYDPQIEPGTGYSCRSIDLFNRSQSSPIH